MNSQGGISYWAKCDSREGIDDITSTRDLVVPHKGGLTMVNTNSSTKKKDGFCVIFDIDNEREGDINSDFLISTLKVQYVGGAPVSSRKVKMKK